MTAALNSCVSSGARHLSGVNITPLRRKASLPDDTHSKIRPANSCRFVKFVSKRPFSVLFNIAPQGRSTSVHERSGSVHERSTFSQGPPLPTPGFIERWTIGDWKLVHSLAWPAKPWRRRIISAWTFDIAVRPRWFISSYQLAYISCTAKRKNLFYPILSPSEAVKSTFLRRKPLQSPEIAFNKMSLHFQVARTSQEFGTQLSRFSFARSTPFALRIPFKSQLQNSPVSIQSSALAFRNLHSSKRNSLISPFSPSLL